MRIYFDSNIFRKFKPTSKQFRQDVTDAVEALAPFFIFPFSEAHLSDLSTSTEAYRKEDLELMERYVHDNFIHRDHIKKEIKYSLVVPTEAYNSYDFTASEQPQQSMDTLLEDLLDFEGGEALQAAFLQLMELPVIPQNDFDTGTLPDSVRPIAENFKNVRSMKDAMQAIGRMGNFINDKSFVSFNRKLFEGYVNRDDYSFDKWSFEFGERMKDTTLGKSFTELVDQITTEADKSDPYQAMLNTYIALETFGVTQEHLGKKQQLKKNSFNDLNKDAAHVFFASKSDYFVSDDIGVQQKAFITYKLMNIDTRVLSVYDFIERSKLLLENEGDHHWFIDRLSTIAKTGTVLHQSEDGAVTLHKAAPPLLNYFNRCQINNYPEGGSLQLFRHCRKKTAVLFSEMALIIEKITRLFGSPVVLPMLDYSKALSQHETGQPIRVWNTGATMLTLQLEKDHRGMAFLVLSLIPISSKKVQTTSR